jgi:acyl-CoA thioester hydrolase
MARVLPNPRPRIASAPAVHEKRIEIRWRDVDNYGHVNNAVYLTYIENARIAYLREGLGLESLDDLLVIVAKVHIDFVSRASLGESLEVGTRVSRIGT